jgi:hypothetical protein
MLLVAICRLCGVEFTTEKEYIADKRLCSKCREKTFIAESHIDDEDIFYNIHTRDKAPNQYKEGGSYYG